MHFFITLLAGIILFFLAPYFPLSTALLFLAACLFLFRRKKALLIPVIALGIVYAFLRSGPADPANDFRERDLRVTGRFLSRPGESGGRSAATFAIEKAFDEGSGDEVVDLEGEELSLISDTPVDDEAEYDLHVETGKDIRRFNPGGLDGGSLRGKVTGIESAREPAWSPSLAIEGFRKRLHEYLFSRFQTDSAALVAALTTGETRFLGGDVKTSFNRAGLAHILSISGTHFGLFSVLLYSAARFLITRLPFRTLRRFTMVISPSQAAALFAMPFMIMYLAISGGSVPAVRSFTMISLFLAGLLIGRKGMWLNSLLFAAVLLALWDPGVVMSLSFQLSFIAVVFIGFSIGQDESDGQGRRVPAWIRNSLRLTLAATLGTAPLVAYHFHYLSLISPLANLVVAPLIGFGIIPLALLSSFVFLFTGQYLFAPVVGMLTDLSLALVAWTADIPFASVPVPSFPLVLLIVFYGFFLVYFAGRSGMRSPASADDTENTGRFPKRLFLIPILPFLVCAVVRTAGTKDLAITFLDVGQGDAAVIELPDRKTIVVDTGRTGKEVLGFLRYSGKEEIDALVLTHIHPDHTGGLKAVLNGVRVRELWDNGLLLYPESLGQLPRVQHLERGDMIEGNGYRITVLHPHASFYTRDGSPNDEENNSSLVIRVEGGERSLLLAGDIGEEAAEDLLHLGRWLKSDVIKIPHHASRRSLHEPFLEAVAPSVAVVSVGRDNAFGHPSPEVLDLLPEGGLFRTDRDGAVKIRVSGRDITARTYRQYLAAPVLSPAGEMTNLKRLLRTW